MKFPHLLFLLSLLLAGCASVATHQEPSANFSRIKTVFVERRLGDDHHLAQLITVELQSLGLEVTNGPRTMQPDRVDAVVRYTDRWEWDFKSYLIEFNLIVRDGLSDKPLAEITYYRPSIVSKTAEVMLHELLPPLFKSIGSVPAKAPVAPLHNATKPGGKHLSDSDAKP